MGRPPNAAEPPTHRVGGASARRCLRLVPGAAPATVAVEADGAPLDLAGPELALALDRSTWRHDVHGWRYARVAPDDADRSPATPDFDDGAWRRAPHLHVVHDAEHAGDAWLRHRFALPAELDGEALTFLLGGRDDEDWQRYTVYLNGTEVFAGEGAGVWRTAHRFVVAPADDAYRAAHFGADNVLAVRVGALQRPLTARQRVESEHYLFQGLLLDQAIAVGDPRAVVERFHVEHVEGSERELHVALRSDDAPGLEVALHYEAEGRVLRKRAVVRNDGPQPVRLLELRLDALAADGTTRGGRGAPVFGERFFAAIEHPAGVSMGSHGRVELWQLPGALLEPGATFASEPAVLGLAAADQTVAEAFLDRVRGFSTRTDESLSSYSALGWYDYTNPTDPLPTLTEELARENLADGDAVRAAGARFDVWMIDDWWSPDDLGRFRDAFPSGGPGLAAAIEEHGLSPGLWWATTRGLWISSQAPGMERALAGGVPLEPQPLVEAASGAWSWNDEFASLFLHEPRFCPAAEPYRGYALDAIPRHVDELGLKLLKLDCATLHCTASHHEHMAGIYSVEPIMNALIEVVARCRAVDPRLWVIWYWGFRSPYWLRFGDLVFDKGIKLEAASPASQPAWSVRQSISLNVDQSIEHARDLLPLESQDSLGVWIGNVAWANRLGKEEWRDGFLLDAARGSRLLQLWGDVTLFDEDDRAFLADALTWAQQRGLDFAATRRVGADPWEDEPYGYLQEGRAGRLLTLFNPTFFHRPVPAIEPVDGASGAELYPVPGADGAADLAPFETRVVQLDAAGTERPPLGRPTRRLDVAALGEQLSGGQAQATVTLPAIARGDHVVLILRLLRDGQWLYHPDPRELFDVRMRVFGIEVPIDAVPRARSRNGPGSPWVRYATAAGEGWSGENAVVDVAIGAGPEVEVLAEALVFDPWWTTRPRRFRAPEPGAATATATTATAGA
jgi:hypothetical protein